MVIKVLKAQNWTYFKGKIGSNGDLGTEVNVAVGVADSKHGVPRSQGLGSHPAAVVLAWSQPLWRSGQSGLEESKNVKEECNMTMYK